MPRAEPPEQAEQGNPSWRGNHQKKLGLSSCITQSLLTASSSQTVASTLRRNPWGRSALEAAEKEGGLWLLTPGTACPARPPRRPRRRPRARWPWCAAGAQGPGSAPAPGPGCKERDTEPLQSTQLLAVLWGSRMHLPSLSAHRAGQSPRANVGALQWWLHWPFCKWAVPGAERCQSTFIPKTV